MDWQWTGRSSNSTAHSHGTVRQLYSFRYMWLDVLSVNKGVRTSKNITSRNEGTCSFSNWGIDCSFPPCRRGSRRQCPENSTHRQTYPALLLGRVSSPTTVINGFTISNSHGTMLLGSKNRRPFDHKGRLLRNGTRTHTTEEHVASRSHRLLASDG